MTADVGVGMGTIATLVGGAVGAITAIFLKEAVQAAMQRRVIAWQLFGYLISWKSQIVRHPPVVAIYDKVKQRTDSLRTAAAKSTEEFQRVHTEQHQERSQLREKVKIALVDSLKKGEAKESRATVPVELAASSLAEQRQMLVDSKSFINDRDAALLGRGPAINVVQFRTSLFYLLTSMEALIQVQEEERHDSIPYLVDQMIVYGEEMLVALIRLEQNTESITKQTLWELTAAVLLGR